MTEWQALILAFLVDLAIGDPSWLPHPVRVIGRGISRCEAFLRRHCATPFEEKKAGILLAVVIVVSVLAGTLLIEKGIFLLMGSVSRVLGSVLFVYLIATTIAVRGLIDAARIVVRFVRKGNLVEARRHLGMVVGRDTETLSEKEVLTAVMETLAENLSDGVVAPIFYFAVGGLPLAMAYKAVNTLDSMVGYKNERYINFGWASARLDDAANYIPARITGLLIVASVFILGVFGQGAGSVRAARRSFRTMRRDGRNHTSPNSGFPEAAMAGAIGVRMGGPSTYGGVRVVKPFIGETGREDYMTASEEEVRVVCITSLLATGMAVLFLTIRGAV
jgi:adenosylcobinamide-phosphate synthase